MTEYVRTTQLKSHRGRGGVVCLWFLDVCLVCLIYGDLLWKAGTPDDSKAQRISYISLLSSWCCQAVVHVRWIHQPYETTPSSRWCPTACRTHAERRPAAGETNVCTGRNSAHKVTFKCSRCASLGTITQTYRWCATCEKSLFTDCFKEYPVALKAEQDRRLGNE